MEKIRSAPAVAHFSLAVHLGTRRHFEFDLLEVVAEKSTGDFGVGADGIFAEDGLEIADGCIDGVEILGDIACGDWNFIYGTGENLCDRGRKGGQRCGGRSWRNDRNLSGV